MKVHSVVLSLSFLMCGQSLRAAETDTFTYRDLPINDSSEIVNKSANENITESLQELKVKGTGCSEVELYLELRKRFGNHTNSSFDEKFTLPLVTTARDVKLEDSVYQDWKSWDGMGMGIHIGKLSKLTMSPVIKIGDQLIGEDKLEHMFGQGFRYFEKNYLDNKGTVAALKKGVLGEKTFLGGNKIGNGVFSYGDLSANFNGMRFWNHILQLRDDVLGKEHNIGPYVECKDQQWVQVKAIDFKYYIDDSMDEATNCAKFPSKKTAEKFTARLSQMGMKCPLDPMKVENMKAKYGQMSAWMINDKGTDAVRYTGEFRKH
jgi:hypothetical protein